MYAGIIRQTEGKITWTPKSSQSDRSMKLQVNPHEDVCGLASHNKFDSVKNCRVGRGFIHEPITDSVYQTLLRTKKIYICNSLTKLKIFTLLGQPPLPLPYKLHL